jgi:S1-C subfamily serine protease
MRFKTIIACFLTLILLSVSAAAAATLTLNDGTVLEGTIIKTSDGYWVKLSDGSSKIVAKEDVQSFSGDADSSASPGTPALSDDSAQAYRVAREHADEADSAAAAVAGWQQFVDKYPDSQDIATARQELDRWKKLVSEDAEKINGVWVGGDDRRKIIDQADELTRQAVDMLDNKQTLLAVDKLKQAVKIYPNSFLTNFSLGYVSLIEGDYDGGAQYFATTIRLQPQSAEAVNNLGVANIQRRRFEIAIDEFLSAAKIQDSKDVVENLVTALAIAPSDLRTLPKMKSTLEAASLLASQYNITGPAAAGFTILPPPMGRPRASGNGNAPDPGPEAGVSGWSGTGFFITSDGLILTNRHVAKGSKTLKVELASGEKVDAQIVAIDDQYDLSLIRLSDRNRKVPCIHLSPEDSPAEGADCVVMGFPMVDQLGFDLKITRGVVSSSAQDQGNGADVLTDAKVNPGNSGGPVVDKFGNVMAIVSMKSLTQGDYDSYGIGISAGHIREFLQRNHVQLPLGDENGPQLSTEDLVTKVKPATVCIIATTN